MIETAGLVRLMTWLSPAFPVGGFNYSHGLEQAVAAGLVADRESLRSWLSRLLSSGSAWNDAVLLAESWRRADSAEALDEIAALASALAGSAERHRETVNQGSAFVAALRPWGLAVLDRLPAAGIALPVAVGAAAGEADLPLEATIAAYLNAFVTNQAQAAQRLLPIGQTGAVAVLAALEAPMADAARRAAVSCLDDLGSSTLNAEIAAMRHEVLTTRIFAT